MKISRSAGYALLAVAYIARYKQEKVVLSQTISKEYDIPVEYLLKVLQQLAKANILLSKRGPYGGFSPARSPKNLSILQVIEAVDGPMVSHLDLAEQTHGSKLALKTEKLYEKALAQARSVFSKTKMASLLN